MIERPAVLVVDDVRANLVSLEALLDDMDCDVLAVQNGNEALRLLLKREFALMLLDVQMPEMDGYEVASHARTNPKTSAVPIVFLTAGQNTDESLWRGYESGAIDFLFKPLNPHVLRSKVAVFLELHRNKQALREEVRAHRKTLDALQASNEALRHFTDAASHDLRAPLRAIRGFLDAMIEDYGTSMDEAARDLAMRALHAASRMESLLQSLLSYSRLRGELDLRPIDCASLLSQVRADLAPRIADCGGAVEIDPLPVVCGDESRLYQLFLNLVGNALKFGRDDLPPRVHVSCSHEGSVATFSVEDNGIGIPVSQRERIFEAFQRLGTKRHAEGSGLGLAICGKIVEQHGGRIWVDESPSGGTTFRVTLPTEARGPA